MALVVVLLMVVMAVLLVPVAPQEAITVPLLDHLLIRLVIGAALEEIMAGEVVAPILTILANKVEQEVVA